MSSSFTQEWIAGFGAGDVEVRRWYRCGPEGLADVAVQRLGGTDVPLGAAERLEWRVFLEPHAPHEAVLKNIERLGDPGALTVVTGQQAGLFGGPLFMLYKAAGAILHARQLQRTIGAPVVPVFWVASDDHDFDEVATHAWMDGAGELRRWTAPASDPRPGCPVADQQLTAEALRDFAETFRASVQDSDFVRTILDQIERLAAEAPVTFEYQFVRLLVRWFGRAGLVPLAPRLSWVRRRAAGVMRAEVQARGATSQVLRERGERLRELGARDGVLHRTGSEANFFVLRDGLRHKVMWNGGAFEALDSATGAVAESWTQGALEGLLASRPEDFSPNAALRPIVQDAVLPNVLYVAGPAEFVYHAQIGALYDRFGVFRPAVLPRPRALLIEPRVRRLLDKLGLDVAACLELGPEGLRREAARRADSAGVQEEIQRRLDEVAGSIARLEQTVADATGDTGLRTAAEKLRQGFEKGSEKLLERADQFLQRRHADIASQADRVAASLWPGDEPQERAIGALAPLLRLGGPHAPVAVMERLDPARHDLQILPAEHLTDGDEASTEPIHPGERTT
ncbi:MAG: bacillithiol biosynthesis cysteine-adding enzyme BshC [Candidatus Sumerlaeia bacterium]|nr:bacillithiol biosynthesis cysteine-adding enzyme BshC [Candidatus Sumerlaeia bacterium]